MQNIIYFLNYPDFRCRGPIIMTPKIPEIMGLPPTAATAIGRSSDPNHGFKRYDRIIEIPLKIPK